MQRGTGNAGGLGKEVKVLSKSIDPIKRSNNIIASLNNVDTARQSRSKSGMNTKPNEINEDNEIYSKDKLES